jgi:hypothetical protein
VYLTGTTNKATLYSNSTGTSLGNPFTANVLGTAKPGFWIFYVAIGQQYDVVGSGGIAPNSYPVPVILMTAASPSTGGGGVPSPPAYSVQAASSPSATTLISDPNITVNPTTHSFSAPNIYSGTNDYNPKGLVDPRTCLALGTTLEVGATGTISSGSLSTLTMSAATFTAGQTPTVVIPGAGPTINGVVYADVTPIVYVSSTVATLTIPATQGVSGANVWMGSDDTSALQTCGNTANTQHKFLALPTPVTPNGCYLITSSLNFTSQGTGFSIIGDGGVDSETSSGGRSTICMALTSRHPGVDLSGTDGAIVRGVTIAQIPGSEDTGGLYGAAPTVGDYGNLNVYNSNISGGSQTTDAACTIKSEDLSGVEGGSCFGNGSALGILLGDQWGAVSASSAYTTPASPGDSNVWIKGNSLIGSTGPIVAQLSGSDAYHIETKYFVAEAASGTGCKIIDVLGSSDGQQLFIVDSRTERQGGCTSTTPLYLESGVNSHDGSIGATLNADGAAPAIGGAGNLDNYNLVIEATTTNAFGMTGSLANSSVRMFAANHFGQICASGTGPYATPTPSACGGNGSQNDKIYVSSEDLLATILSGLEADIPQTEVCAKDHGCSALNYTFNGSATFNGSMSVAGTLGVAGLSSLNGGINTTTILAAAGGAFGPVSIGLLSNIVKNSAALTAGSWVQTTGSWTITANTSDLTDPWGGNNATKIVTDTGGTYVDTDSSNPIAANTNYNVCDYFTKLTGAPEISLNAGGGSSTQIAISAVWPKWQYVCVPQTQGASVSNPTYAHQFNNQTGSVQTFYVAGASTTLATNNSAYLATGSLASPTPAVVISMGPVIIPALGTAVLPNVLPSVVYSAAGTALPSCTSAIVNTKAVVSDATTPTYLGTYTSGGTVHSPVFCNGSAWVTY